MREQGFEVAECRTSADALSAVAGFLPEAVLIVTGEDNGEACSLSAQLRSGASTMLLPIIHVTPPGRAAIIRSLEYADVCIPEPVDPPVLAAALESMVRRFRMAGQLVGRAGRLYRSIAEHLPDAAVCVVDRELRCIIAEGRALERVGLSSRELEGRQVSDFDASGAGAALARRLAEVLAGKSFCMEAPYRGRIFFAQLVPLRNERAETMAAMVVATDITERKRTESALRESEDRYRQLYESSPIGVASARNGPDGLRIIAANDAWLAMTGYSREDLQGEGIACRNLSLPESLPSCLGALAEARGRGRSRIFEKECVTKDGRRLPVILGFATVGRKPDELVSFAIDITERKRLEERLHEAQKIESIGVLAGGVAHDFNNLLTTILGNASLLAEMLPPSSPEMTRVRQIIRSSEHAADLTRQLLAYAGKGSFVTVDLDVSQAVHDLLPLLRSSIPATVSLELDLNDSLPVVRADRGQLHQIVVNLVMNAAEACGDRPSVIRVRTALREVPEDMARAKGAHVRPGPHIIMEIADGGAGIDPAILPRIFEPFFTTKFAGRGLGLAAVQGIVRRHGGFLEVESKPGRGACFRVLLPAAVGQAITAEAADD